MTPLSHLLPPLSGLTALSRTYAPWPVWTGSTTSPVRFAASRACLDYIQVGSPPRLRGRRPRSPCPSRWSWGRKAEEHHADAT
jgi:hypothetical protein